MNQTYIKKERLSPVQEEMTKHTSNYNLTVVTEQDFETMALFKNIAGFIAYKTTLSKGNQLLSIGYGSAVCNRLNKFIERNIIFAKNSSLIDAMVRSTKILDALSIVPINEKEKEVDLERRDEPAFFNDEDLPQFATDKQRSFLEKLINNKCDDTEKEEYLNRLKSPYLSKFDCSELINSLLPTN